MTHPSKRKGNAFERKLVKVAEAAGVHAERAYASDGRALGKDKECDVILKWDSPDPEHQDVRWKFEARIQAKKSKAHPEWPWKHLENVDVLVIGRNRKPPLAILPYEKLLELLQ